MLVSLVFVILALVEFAFVALLSRRDKSGEDNQTVETVGGEIDASDETSKGKEMSNEQTVAVNGWFQELKRLEYQKKIKLFSKLPSIYIVDVLSFLLFAVLFVLFNIIYWISYKI